MRLIKSLLDRIEKRENHRHRRGSGRLFMHSGWKAGIFTRHDTQVTQSIIREDRQIVSSGTVNPIMFFEVNWMQHMDTLLFFP
jgi:hypothetical protein